MEAYAMKLEQTHILIIEDDEDINHLLYTIVKNAGYSAQSAFSGTEAMLLLEHKNWDLILLDLMLPGKSGEEVLAKIRERSDIPIIIISAKEEQWTKVNMLRQGADDYITKPFDHEEVLARIEVQLRRYQPKTKNKKLTFKDIVLDPALKKVYVNQQEVSLTVREYNILHLFLSSPKKVFTKENVFESVWQEPYYGDENTVNVHMSHLRKKLAEANPAETYIETLWGMGYRLKH